MSFVARLALELASPDGPRVGGNVGDGNAADYSQWPLGLFLAPINPDFIEAAESDKQTPTPANAAATPVPTVLIAISTATPTPPIVTAEATPTPSGEPAPLEEPTRTLSPSPTRTVTPIQAPAQVPPTSTRRPATPTSTQPSATPVTDPSEPTTPPTNTPVPPTRTNTPVPPSPVRTNTPTPSPTRTNTPGPSPTPTNTPTPSPTLTPMPPTFGFLQTALVVDEPVGPGSQATVELRVRLGTAYHLPITVTYQIGDAGTTATEGTDYVQETGSLTFDPGDTVKSFLVKVLGDRLDEANEYVTVRLSTATNATSNGSGEAIVTIADSNLAPTVRFTSAGHTVGESVGSTSFMVELSEVSALAVSVPYTVDGTAGNGDHTLRNGAVLIRPSAKSVRVNLDIVNDRIDENDEQIVVTMGTPLNADRVGPAAYTITIVDDDTAGVAVSPVTLALTEVPTATNHIQKYSVVLTSQPTAPVTITVRPNAQATVSPSTIVFTQANWSVPVPVSVRAVDDDVDEPDPHTGLITHTVASADPFYANLPAARRPSNVNLTIADNDTAGVVVSPTALNLSETPTAFNYTRTYTVALTSQPTAPVTVGVLPDDQATVSPATLVFNATNWRSPQTVTVTAVDDDVDEVAIHAGLITHTVASADPFYASLPPARRPGNVSLSITDNDIAGVDVRPTALSLSESLAAPNHTRAYTVALTSQPTAPVTITVLPDDQATVSAATLVFNATNWRGPLTVTVTAVDDDFDEPNAHTGLITHTVASADPFYAGLPADQLPDDVSLTIADNDTAGIAVTPGALALSEAGTPEPNSGTYTVTLTSRPTRPVTVNLTLTITDAAQLSLTPDQLVFGSDPLSWKTPQTVTVIATQDLIDEGISSTLSISHTASSGDTTYGGLAGPQKQVTITDDDVAGVVVNPTGLDLSETPTALDHTRTYTVVLTSQPTAPVTISVLPDAQATVSPPALVFDATDWQSPLTVTVTAVDDDFDEPDPHTGLITHTVASADPFYAGLPAAQRPGNVGLTIADNDTAGIAITPGDLALSEAGTPEPSSSTYTVTLTSRPTRPVTVTLTLTDTAQLSLTPSQLVFGADPLSWKTPQTVTVSVTQDLIDEAPDGLGYSIAISHTASSGDTTYNGLNGPAKQVTITDDDTAGVVISTGALDLSESPAALDHTRTYTVALTSQPPDPVTVTVLPDAQASVSPSVLVFNAANWTKPLTVTVSAVDDDYDELDVHSGLITHTVTSADPFYGNLPAARQPADVSLTVADDDTAGITITPGALALSEAGTPEPNSGTYTVTLTSRPFSPVTVTLTVTDTAQLSLTPSQLVFGSDPLGWRTPQTITVTATQDRIDEGTASALAISHTAASDDTTYDGMGGPEKQVTIADDDTAGLVITTSATAVVEGANITYTVRLNSEPQGDVTLTLADSPAGAITVTPASLLFSAANWMTPVEVHVDAADNFVLDGQRPVTITHSVDTSGDAFYGALGPEILSLTVQDDDVAGLTFDAPMTIGEGQSAGYGLTLSAQPADDVAVTLGLSAGLEADQTTVTFTPATWNITRTVTLTALDNRVLAGDAALVVTHTLSSADPDFDGAGPFGFGVTVIEDDVAGLSTLPGSLALSEAAGLDQGTFAIALTSEPTEPVTVTLAFDTTQLSVSPAELIFTATNYSQTQEVTVTAVDDATAETTPHGSTITLSSSSKDPFYHAAWPDYSVQIDDNDVAGVAVQAPASPLTSEAGLTTTVRIWLTSQPTAPVTVSVGTSDLTEARVSVAAPWALPLVFDESNWSTPVTVTVEGLNDADADGPQPYSVLISDAVSADPFYNALAPDTAAIAMVNEDDEPALVAIDDAAAVREGDGGTVSATFPVRLTRTSSVTVTVDYTTYDLSAVAGEDFAATTGTVTFAPGVTSGVVTVAILGDTTHEPDELIGVQLGVPAAPGDVTGLLDGSALGMIENDDPPG